MSEAGFSNKDLVLNLVNVLPLCAEPLSTVWNQFSSFNLSPVGLEHIAHRVQCCHLHECWLSRRRRRSSASWKNSAGGIGVFHQMREVFFRPSLEVCLFRMAVRT